MQVREFSYDQIDEMQQIAKTIRQQIGVANLMSCGAREWQFAGWRGDKQGVQFRVNAGSKRQYIKILLAANDTYTVTCFRLKRITDEHVDVVSYDDIYCENLGETVYRMVNK